MQIPLCGLNSVAPDCRSEDFTGSVLSLKEFPNQSSVISVDTSLTFHAKAVTNNMVICKGHPSLIFMNHLKGGLFINQSQRRIIQKTATNEA